MMKIKKAQIWVETVVYTLIGLVIIGILLAIATPAIDRYKDDIIIEQTIIVLNNLNDKIIEARDSGAGNKRIVELRIKKGELKVDSVGDKIIYILEESRLEYSELGEDVQQGDIIIKTNKKGEKSRRFDISLALSYENVNLKYNDDEEQKIFHPAEVPYKLSIENNGTASDGERIQIILTDIS